MKRRMIVFAIVVCGMFGALFCGSNAFADVDTSGIMKKWLLSQYIACIQYGKNEPELTPINATTKVAAAVFKNAKEKKMHLPSYSFGGVTSGQDVSCDEMFNGGSSISNKGLLSYSKMDGSVTWVETDKTKQFLEGLGYEFISGSNEKTIQINLTPTYEKGNPYTKLPVGTLSYNSSTGKYSYDEAWIFSSSLEGNTLVIDAGEGENSNGYLGIDMCMKYGGGANGWNKIRIPLDSDFNKTVENVRYWLGDAKWNFWCGSYGRVMVTVLQDEDIIVGGEGHYKYPDKSETTKAANALTKAVNNLSGQTDGIPGAFWSKVERYSIYTYYIQQAAQKAGGDGISCDVEKPSGTQKQVRLKDDSGKLNKDCYADLNYNNDTVYILSFKKDGSFPYIKTATIFELIDWLNTEDFSAAQIKKMPTLSAASGMNSTNNGDDDDAKSRIQQVCDNQGGAGSLGWIICPALVLLSDASTDIYNQYVEPSLRVDPQLFTAGNEGVRAGWENFRNIANVIFIILILAVLFSQLTGLGIDNYGIKKILPKLIVAAILINLSYLICILMVDLSNILGNGLRMMFDGLPTNGTGVAVLDIPDAFVRGTTEHPSVDTGNETLLTVATLAALGLMVGAVWQNPAILLSLFVAAVGVAVSIFFLFVLLSVREAGVIVMVVASPLAVAAYMLPNTKKLFDKWWKLFEGLLLVYPICGLLVGGGNYISKLLLSTEFAGGGFLKAFTAMIVGIVPIFFIPTVLKSSFSAMGKVGGMLAGLGDRARRGTTGAMRNNDAYKNAQRRGLERKAKVKAGYSEKKGRLNLKGQIKSKLATSGGVVGAIARGSGWAKAQAAYVDQAKGIRDENIKAKGTLMNASRDYDIAKNSNADSKEMATTQINKAAKRGAADLEAAIAAVVSSGTVKEKDIAEIIRDSLNHGEFSKLEKDGSLRGVLERMNVQYGNGFLATDAELEHYTRTGGVNGELGEWGEYASAHMEREDIKPEAFGKLSGNSIGALALADKITPDLAKDVMARNLNISGDKKIMIGALADGLATKGGIEAAGDTAEERIKAFKKDAEELLKGHDAPNHTIHADADYAKRWVAPAPQNVHLV